MPNRSVRLVQFTDTHLLADPAGAMRGAVTLPRLEACSHMPAGIFFPWTRSRSPGTSCRTSRRLTAHRIAVRPPRRSGAGHSGNHDEPTELRRRLGSAPFQVGGEFRTATGWQVLLLESWFAESADGEGKLGARQLAELGTHPRSRNGPQRIGIRPPSTGADGIRRPRRARLARRRGIPRDHREACSSARVAWVTHTRHSISLRAMACGSCAHPRRACSSRLAIRGSWSMTGRPAIASSTCTPTVRSLPKWSGSRATSTRHPCVDAQRNAELSSTYEHRCGQQARHDRAEHVGNGSQRRASLQQQQRFERKRGKRRKAAEHADDQQYPQVLAYVQWSSMVRTAPRVHPPAGIPPRSRRRCPTETAYPIPRLTSVETKSRIAPPMPLPRATSRYVFKGKAVQSVLPFSKRRVALRLSARRVRVSADGKARRGPARARC